MRKWILTGALIALLTVTALALPQVVASGVPAAPASAPADTATPAPADEPSMASWERRWKYTEADYRLAMSFQTEGYEGLSLGEFNKKLMDWNDETLFHRREEALRRLTNSYERDGVSADFIRRTLYASYEECMTKHYGGYCTQMTPVFCDGAARVRMEDVFGDSYPVFQAEADYDIHYRVEDEAKLTVGERDKLFLAYRQAVQTFLNAKTEAELKKEEDMEKALTAELKRLDQQLSTKLITLTGTELSCYDAYDYRD